MKNFSQIVNEVRKNYDSGSLLSSEIAQYLNKVNKKIPERVKNVIYMTQKYNLLDSQSVEEIKNSNKGSLKMLSGKYNIPLIELEDLWKMLKEIKDNIRLLPQFQSPQERRALELGKLSMNDLTIDLKTQQGRNAATKVYGPLIYKIVNQYVGKSKLSKQELISAALLGFNSAMNDWNGNEENNEKYVTFKTYASYRIQQQILNDINKFGHSLSGTNSYAVKNYGVEILDAISIDGMPKDYDGELNMDRLGSLGVEDPDTNLTKDEKRQWDSLYKLIENNFKQRDVDIFYRYFGLNGYKREKVNDIAKSMNMSNGNIRNSIINKIILFLKKDKKAIDILQNIQDIYNESLIVELVGFTKEQIIEALESDDMFILLEELNKWNNRLVFMRAISDAVKNFDKQSVLIIMDLLKNDFEYLDSNFKKNKNLIILFLRSLYPTENMNRKTDMDLLEYMMELHDYYNKYKL